MVDAEQKSVRIESLITRILSKFIDFGETFSIKTSSNLIDYFKSNLTETPFSLKFQDGSSLSIPSICNLTNGKHCSSQHPFVLQVK